MIYGMNKDSISVRTDAQNFGNKDEVLNAVARLASSNPLLSKLTTEDLYNALLKREQISSTGLEGGVAIPHCSFENLDGFVTGLLVIPEGVEFDSMDGKPARFVFFIIGPSEERNRHVRILSSISKLSRDKEVLNKIASASSSQQIVDLLDTTVSISDAPRGSQKCQFTIVIQREELFLDILEILSSEVEGSVSVIESQRASSYLNRLPLFSAFWNEDERGFCRVIQAVVDKSLMNDTVRRINMIRPEDGTGVLISVSDLLYNDGSIDF